MTSHAMGRCCAEGVKHEGTAKGEIKKIDDIRTYFVYPENKSTQNALVIFTDARGLDAINVQLIADQFAANGYLVAIPDLFNGSEFPTNPPADWSIEKYVADTMPRVPTVDPKVETTIKHLRGELGVKRLGGVGYCFGGKYVCRWMKEGGIDAGYTAHPSFVDKEELEGITGALSISAAEIDQIFSAEKRRETEDILKELSFPYQINLFSNVSHGFAVRCDLSKPKEKFAKEQAFFQAVAWLDEYVKQV